MSRINDLIKELCPNGVKFKKVWEVTSWDKKYNAVDKSMQPRIMKYNYLLASKLDELVDMNGDVLILETGISNNKKYTTEELAGDNLCEGEIIAIPWGGTPNVKYYNGKFITGDNRIAVSNDTKVLNTKFLYHLFNNRMDEISDFYRGSGIKHPEMKKILMMDIPMPPIEVQEEIIRILDKFGELEAELEAELEERKRQYEFWYGKVFDNIDAKFVKLSDLCKIGDGLHGTPRYLDDGDYYFINGNNLMNGKILFDEKTKKVSKTEFENQNIKLDKNTLLMSINGTIGKVSYYDDEKIMLGKSVAYFSILDEKVLSKKYLFYLLQAPRSVRYYNDSLTGSTILNLGLKALREFEIPLPPIEEQNKISNILEHFDKLINDITVGIPAEIELRRKQYEYYRNKLLTFEEI